MFSQPDGLMLVKTRSNHARRITYIAFDEASLFSLESQVNRELDEEEAAIAQRTARRPSLCQRLNLRGLRRNIKHHFHEAGARARSLFQRRRPVLPSPPTTIPNADNSSYHTSRPSSTYTARDNYTVSSFSRTSLSDRSPFIFSNSYRVSVTTRSVSNPVRSLTSSLSTVETQLANGTPLRHCEGLWSANSGSVCSRSQSTTGDGGLWIGAPSAATPAPPHPLATAAEDFASNAGAERSEPVAGNTAAGAVQTRLNGVSRNVFSGRLGAVARRDPGIVEEEVDGDEVEEQAGATESGEGDESARSGLLRMIINGSMSAQDEADGQMTAATTVAADEEDEQSQTVGAWSVTDDEGEPSSGTYSFSRLREIDIPRMPPREVKERKWWKFWRR